MENTIAVQKPNHWLAKRVPFYYGWIIVPISIVGTVLTSPGQTFMISVFNPTFRETFNLTLSQLTGAYMLGTILASLPQPYLGVWMDRIGIRRMLFIVVTMFTLACLVMSQANGLPMLFLSFLMLRMFGQGALELLSTNMLPMWFDKTLGSISGVKNVLVNLLVGVVPISVLFLINRIGWRSTYILAAMIVFLFMMLISFFLYINRPADIGQTIDQHRQKKTSLEKQAATINDTQKEFTLKEAFKTKAYWILTAAWFSWAAIATAITFNLLPIFTAKGLTEEQAAGTFTILMVVSGFAQLIGGFLADRIALRALAFGALLLYAAAVSALVLLPNNSVVLVYVLILGLAQGLFGGLGNTVWVRYYGRKHLGKIRGSVWTAAVAGSSIGPFLMGVSYDKQGDFYSSLTVIAIILIALAIAALWATPPKIQDPSPA